MIFFGPVRLHDFFGPDRLLEEFFLLLKGHFDGGGVGGNGGEGGKMQ